MNIPDLIAESLETTFAAHTDPGWKEFRSGIKHPGSAIALLKIISEPEIDAEVELDGGVHDVLGGPLHAVVQAGVDNVLLRGAGHTLVKLNTRRAFGSSSFDKIIGFFFISLSRKKFA
jgi:hypothetical protein